MQIEDIARMTRDELLDEETFAWLFDIDNAFLQTRCVIEMEHHAAQIGCKSDFSRMLKAFDTEYKKKPERDERIIANSLREVRLEQNNSGYNATTIENFKRILDEDQNLRGRLRYNELTNMPERVHLDNTLEPWTDADTSFLRHYIEHKYKIHSAAKLEDAMNQVFDEHRYHPIRTLILSLEWDGVPRIGRLFSTYLKAEDTPYTRECERLVFAGGIHRLFDPGCKFDCNIIFVGGQGCGKSTMSRWLAISDDYYREVSEIDGQKGIESIRGVWVAEFSELLALKRTKDVEAVKSFITRQCDTYRPPFKHYIENFPRQCIFLGTTNTPQFLNDKSGGRRFLPVHCYSNGRDLYDREEEIREYIRQCWAEAYVKYQRGEMPPVEDRNLMDVIRQKQEDATEDDYRVGMIESYLDAPERDRVCVLEIWQEALGELGKPSKKDSNEIAAILDTMQGWARTRKSLKCGSFGKQRVWERCETPSAVCEEYEF